MLAAALLAALVWILRLLVRRLIPVLAGLSGLIALSILLTILALSGTSNICICAFAVVAPGVRFNAFAIFVAPALMQPEDSVYGA